MGGKREWELMLEIGNKSKPLTKKLPNGFTHKWTVYVRGVDNSKIEHCISHVVFQLHESFENPYRDITEPPFQTKETGWAGFEIPIQVFFKNRDKPNHLVFVHDLSLLNNKSNSASSIEKIKFINPNKEFEKCLHKSGAQLLTAPSKKDRCDSPPAKKQKSSSIIPSKDMSKLSQLQTQTQPHHHQSHHKSSQQSHNGHHGGSNHSSKQPFQSQPAPTKPKSSSAFIDVFGNPLRYNQNTTNNTGKATNSSNKHSLREEHREHPRSGHKEHSREDRKPQETKHRSPPPGPDPLQLIQNKISNLSDCDRLQKIVDIIEEAGEWFNLTSKKFEFDLKRLDRKTLTRIERCLSHV